MVGVFRERAPHVWPLIAGSAEELRQELAEKGHLLPLPSEPAALANVMEIELREHLTRSLEPIADAEVSEGTERSFPDLEFSGMWFGGGIRAVDIKCARRKISKAGDATGSLNNRIALYTGNTYFLWPTLKFSGILRPFGEYEELLSIVVVYTFVRERPERIMDVDVVVHETWRIASRSRASATREYIGSVRKIEDVVAGNSEFESAQEFYEYWRDSRRNWKKSPEAERLLRRAIDIQD